MAKIHTFLLGEPMDANSKSGPFFYSILFNDDCTSKLQIPSQFVKNHGENLGPRTTLRTNLSEKSWSVGVEQIGRHHFFTDGWSKFAKNVDLKLRDFLLFHFVDGSTFYVTVYDTAGCQREPHYFGDEALVVKRDQFTDPESWRFSKELKKHHFTDNRMLIPKSFAVGTGIARNRKIKLEDGQGRQWPIKVTDGNIGKFSFTCGWKNFRTANKVVVGSTISFEFIPGSGNVVRALVIKDGTRKKPI